MSDSQYEYLQVNITEDNLDEVNEAAVEVVQEAQQTETNAQLVRDVIFTTAELARNNPSLIDEEVKSNLHAAV